MIELFICFEWASLVTQKVKNLLAMQETWVQSLGWEDLLEEGKATHSSILAWRIPRDRGAWWATVHGVAKSIKCVANTLFSVRGLSFYFTYIAYFDE